MKQSEEIVAVSMSKHYLFDPEFAPQRQQAAAAAIHAHPHRILIRRKNRVASASHWDSHWEGAIDSAANELGVSCIRVNDGMCFQQQADRDQVHARAEELWEARHAHYKALMRK